MRAGISHQYGLCLHRHESDCSRFYIGDHQSGAVHPSQNCGQMYAGRETVREDQKLYLSAAAPKTNQDSTAHQLEIWRAAWF